MNENQELLSLVRKDNGKERWYTLPIMVRKEIHDK